MSRLPRKRIDMSLSHDEFEDLNNALEDHRDGFKKMAVEAAYGLGLEPGYWEARAEDVQSLLESVHEHSSEEPAESESEQHPPNGA